MTSISYNRRTDVSIAFAAMTLSLGFIYVTQGFHLRAVYRWYDILSIIGSLGALYIFLHQYLPTDRGRRGRHLRSIR